MWLDNHRWRWLNSACMTLLFLGCMSLMPENLLCVSRAVFECRPCWMIPAPHPCAAPSRFGLPYINLREPWRRFLLSARFCWEVPGLLSELRSALLLLLVLCAAPCNY